MIRPEPGSLWRRGICTVVWGRSTFDHTRATSTRGRGRGPATDSASGGGCHRSSYAVASPLPATYPQVFSKRRHVDPKAVCTWISGQLAHHSLFCRSLGPRGAPRRRGVWSRSAPRRNEGSMDCHGAKQGWCTSCRVAVDMEVEGTRSPLAVMYIARPSIRGNYA
jgi:hypothetical protein